MPKRATFQKTLPTVKKGARNPSPPRETLTDCLTDEQKELFEDYMTAQREVNVLTDCETFCMAFKLGAKIMLDVLNDGPMKEI